MDNKDKEEIIKLKAQGYELSVQNPLSQNLMGEEAETTIKMINKETKDIKIYKYTNSEAMDAWNFAISILEE